MKTPIYLLFTIVFIGCTSNETNQLSEENKVLTQRVDSLQNELKKFDFGYWFEGIGIGTITNSDFIGVNDTLRTAIFLTAITENHPLIIRSDSAFKTENNFTLLGKIDTIRSDEFGGEAIYIPKKTGTFKQYYKVVATGKNNKQAEVYASQEIKVYNKNVVNNIKKELNK